MTAAACEAQPAQQPDAKMTEIKIIPTFEDLKETTFAGIAAFAGPGSPRFPELWQGPFQDVTKGLDGKPPLNLGLDYSRYAYGLELYPPTFDEKRQYTYLACLAVSDSRKVPLHLLQRTVPAARYAVFKVPGGLKGLGDTFQFIYGKWLPTSGYDTAASFDMERYDVGPGGQKDGDLSIEVLLPVVAKK